MCSSGNQKSSFHDHFSPVHKIGLKSECVESDPNIKTPENEFKGIAKEVSGFEAPTIESPLKP